MKVKKIALIGFIVAIMCVVMAFSVSALGNYDDLKGNYLTDSVCVNIGTTEYDFFNYFDILYFDTNISENRVLFLIDVDISKLITYLKNNDYVNNANGCDVVEFIDFWNISSFQPYFDDTLVYTNIDNTLTLLNFVGGYLHYVNDFNTSNGNYEELQQQYNELQTQYDELQTEHNELQQQYNELQTQYDELQTEHNELQSLYTELQTQYEGLQIEYEAIMKQYNEALDLNTTLEAENERLEQSVNNLADLNDELMAENERLENSLLENSDNYQRGYNQAISDFEMFKGGVVTLISTPIYFLNSILGFEIFGFNFFTVVQFIISIALVIWVIKKIK